MTNRIAFASIDGTHVDQHFGSARYWQIYDITDGESVFIETRKTKGNVKCGGNCEGGFEHLFAVLYDSDAVFAAKIGEGAAAYMIGKGKRVFQAEGEVEEIIAELIENNQLGELG